MPSGFRQLEDKSSDAGSNGGEGSWSSRYRCSISFYRQDDVERVVYEDM